MPREGRPGESVEGTGRGAFDSSEGNYARNPPIRVLSPACHSKENLGANPPIRVTSLPEKVLGRIFRPVDLHPLDRDRIRANMCPEVQKIVDHTPSGERPEKLKEIYLAANKEAAGLEPQRDVILTVLIRSKTVSIEKLCKAADVSKEYVDDLSKSVVRGAPDVTGALEKLGSITERCAHAQERAAAAHEQYYKETGERLDGFSAKTFILRQTGSAVAECMLIGHGVHPLVAKPMAHAFVDAILGPPSRTERLLDKSISLTEHVRDLQ